VFQSSAYSTATFTSYSVSTSSDVYGGVSSYFVSTLYTTTTLYVPSSTTYSTGCATVTACCTTTVTACSSAKALACLAGAAAVAIAVGVAVPLGTPTPVVESPPNIEIFSFNNLIPENLNPTLGNYPDDGCGTSSGRFDGDKINSNEINGRKSIGIISRRQSTQKTVIEYRLRDKIIGIRDSKILETRRTVATVQTSIIAPIIAPNRETKAQSRRTSRTTKIGSGSTGLGTLQTTKTISPHWTESVTNC